MKPSTNSQPQWVVPSWRFRPSWGDIDIFVVACLNLPIESGYCSDSLRFEIFRSSSSSSSRAFRASPVSRLNGRVEHFCSVQSVVNIVSFVAFGYRVVSVQQSFNAFAGLFTGQIDTSGMISMNVAVLFSSCSSPPRIWNCSLRAFRSEKWGSYSNKALSSRHPVAAGIQNVAVLVGGLTE
jgi:hypothetical protein